MNKIIEQTREASENEFFFRQHENVGMSRELERLINYINANSNIFIERVEYETIDQMVMSKSYSGGSYNLKIHPPKEKDKLK